MQYKMNLLFKESLWLLVSAILAFLFAGLLFGWSFINGTIDLHIHDTYFGLPKWLILSTLLFLVIFILYFIKEKRRSFAQTFSNWIVISSGMLVVILLTVLIKKFSEAAAISTRGWTMYPPLSALSDPEPRFTGNPIANLIANALIIVQLLSLILLLHAAYKLGTKKKIKH